MLQLSEKEEGRPITGLWIEKYRSVLLENISNFNSKIFSDMPYHRNIICRLKSYTDNGSLPNLVLYGRNGSGKTSVVYAVARELYGDNYEANLTHISASDFFYQGKKYLASTDRFKRFYDDRKSVIKMFKDAVNEYAALAPINANFKIIFFDDAESLTYESQQALRRMMERYSHTCRFIFSTTQITRLIPPIRSRCVNLHLRRLTDHSIKEVLTIIAEEESVRINEEGLSALTYLSKGDAEYAVNVFQAAASKYKKEINSEAAFEVAERIKIKETGQMIQNALSGDFKRAITTLDQIVVDKGLSGEEILERIRDEVLYSSGQTDRRTAVILKKMGEVDINMKEGSNERIHLQALLSQICADYSKPSGTR